MKDLPPSLRRFLSPRRSMRSSEFAEGRRSVEVARLSGISSISERSQLANGAQHNGAALGRQGSGGSGALAGANGHAAAAQVTGLYGSPPHGHQQHSSSRGSLASHGRSISHTSLGAAAAANVLLVAGSPGGADAEAVAAGVAAGIRAAELQQAQQQGGGSAVLRPPLPRSHLAGRSRSAELVRGGGSGRGTPDLAPGHASGGRLTPDPYFGAGRGTRANQAAAAASPPALHGTSSGGEHVTIELGEVSLATTEDGSDDGSAARPLVRPGKPGS